MLAQVINNCQGPHYIQGQNKDGKRPPLLILRPGMNLVNSKQLADWRKDNKGFDALFSTPIKLTRGDETVLDYTKNGKPMLEVRAGELNDKAPLASESLKLKDALEIVRLTEDTDYLSAWRADCSPEKQSDLIKAINDRAKEITTGIQAA